MKEYLSIKSAIYLGIGILLIYSLTGFLLVPFAGKKIIKDSIHDYLGRSSEIESLFLNPFTLEFRVKNFKVSDTTGSPFLMIQNLYLNLSVSSLFRLAPVITHLEIEKPEVFLVLNKDGKLNIPELTGKQSEPKADEQPGSKSNDFQFRLSNAWIKNGAVHFSDEIRRQTHVVGDLNLNLPLLSSMEGEQKNQARPALHFQINDAPVEIRAVSLPFDTGLDTRIQLSVKNLDLSSFEKYLNLPQTIKLASPGHLDLSVSGEYSLKDSKKKGLAGHNLKVGAKVVLKGLDIRTRENTPLFSCPEFMVEADSPDLFSRQLVIQNLWMNQARLNIERDETGQLTLPGLIFPRENIEFPDQPEPPAQDLNPKFHITMVKGGLNRSAISFTDTSVTPPFATTLSKLNITLENLKVATGSVLGAYKLDFQTEVEEELVSKGEFTTEPELLLNGRIDLKGILPEKYRPYYSSHGGKHLMIGKTDAGAGFKFEQKDDLSFFSIHEGDVGLEYIRIQETIEDSPVLDIKGFDLTGIQVNSKGQLVRIGQVSAGNGRLNLRRDKAGEINLLQLLSDLTGSAGKARESQPAKLQNSDVRSIPWQFELGQFTLENYDLAFSDFMQKDPVHLTARDIMILAENLTTAAGSQGKVKASMIFQDKGKLDIKGNLLLSDPSAGLDLNIGRIQLQPLQPYLTEHLNILISKGHMGSKGRLTMSFSDPQHPKIRFTGQADLIDFITKKKSDKNDFFKCKSLYLAGMDISLTPVKVKVKEIALTDFYQKTIISKSGQLNLKDIMVEKTKDTGTSKATGPEIEIRKITLQGGHINFADYYNTPGFVANMTEIGGSITGLSSSQDNGPAALRLKGTHSNHSPLDISGKIDPFKKEPFADIAISFKNIELPEFNAYAEKYLGYEIEKGKLILDLKYNIQDGKLNSSNHIFFDQFTLGNSVDSPDATSMPVQLAISLLKNPNDEIKLDVPIQGDLNDPEFSYGAVVLTALKNLILGVVTAPFKFLGSIVGIADNQDLGYVEFDFGSDALDQENLTKIDYLTKILTDKVTLNLEIDGKYNPAKDGEQLRQQKYEALLISFLPEEERTKEIFGQLSTEDRGGLVESAYSLAKFPKPRDESGKEKEISLPEKEKLLITALEVDKEELNALGRSRSKQIRDYMVNSGEILPTRIFITDPDPVTKDHESESQVKTLFVLK